MSKQIGLLPASKTESPVTQPDSPLPLRNIKIIIYSKVQINRASLYSDAAADKRWKTLLKNSDRVPSSLSRSVGVKCFRLWYPQPGGIISSST
ncbi:hypothetical protein TNCV_2136911 [Trichonephila clavipes]|nr:hypothetical protein TNCV_2136911 [Trichonephila clavipes]